MKLKITLITLFIGFTTIAQIKFEKGHLISKNGIKIECFIKDEGWQFTPKKIKYKISEDSEILIKETDDLEEFQINDKLKYKRYSVELDASSDQENSLGENRISEYKEQNLLLEILIEGETSLLSYQDNDIKRFFYKLGSNIICLEYKLYLDSNKAVRKNLNYKKQLKDNFKCEGLSSNKIEYNKNDLTHFFSKYNKCSNTESFINYFKKNEKKGFFKTTGKISFNNASYINSSSIGYKIGIEFEYVFPYNNNLWSIFIEPTFQSNFSSKNDKIIIGHKWVSSPSQGSGYAAVFSTGEIKYSSIELPIALRHYFMMKNTNKFFLNAGINTDIVVAFNQDASNLKSSLSALLGLGYNFKNKYTLELRYNSPRNLTTELGNVNVAEFKNTSLKFGYIF